MSKIPKNFPQPAGEELKVTVLDREKDTLSLMKTCAKAQVARLAADPRMLPKEPPAAKPKAKSAPKPVTAATSLGSAKIPLTDEQKQQRIQNLVKAREVRSKMTAVEKAAATERRIKAKAAKYARRDAKLVVSA